MLSFHSYAREVAIIQTALHRSKDLKEQSRVPFTDQLPITRESEVWGVCSFLAGGRRVVDGK